MEDLSIRLRNSSTHRSAVARAFPFLKEEAAVGERADVECLFLPGREGFTGNADCSVLVLTERVARPPLGRADVLVTDLPGVSFDAGPRFGMSEMDRMWEAIL